MSRRAPDETKIKAAQAKLAEAEKCMSTGLFKWSPDHQGAAIAYDRAAKQFKAAKQPEEAMLCFMKSAECHKELNTPNSSGRGFEQAAMLARELGNTDKAAALFYKASHQFRNAGNSVQAAKCLSESSSIIEKNNPQKAAEMLEQAIDLYEADDKEYLTPPVYKTLTLIYCGAGEWNKAIEVQLREINVFQDLNQPHNVFRTVLNVVVCYLSLEQFELADKYYNDQVTGIGGFSSSGESLLCADMLDCFEAGNNERLQEVVQRKANQFRDVEFAKLAKELKITQLHGNVVENLSDALGEVSVKPSASVDAVEASHETAAAQPDAQEVADNSAPVPPSEKKEEDDLT